MEMMLQTVATILLCLAGIGCVLHIFASIRLARFFSKRLPQAPSPAAFTFWRALKPNLPDLADKLDALLAATRQDDQLLIGVDRDSPEEALCKRWQARHRDRDITIAACEPDRAKNPKISKFLQMEPLARHPHWLLIDSEAVLSRDLTEALRSEWIQSGADCLTAGYRFTRMRAGAQWLDTLPAAITLWPGLMMVPRLTFTLGACVAINQSAIEALGGWKSVGDHLAEDHELGQRLAANGRSVTLSRNVIELESDAVTPTDYLRHQHRLAVTYRAANPAGTAGLPIFHVVPLAILAAMLAPNLWPIAGVCIAVRALTACFEAATLKMLALPAVLLIPVTLLMECIFWLASWLPLPIWWASRWRRITFRGILR